MLLGVLALIASTTVTAGCSTTSERIDPPVEVPGEFSETGALEMPERWWTAFEDEELDAALERALVSNLDLKGAWERLQAARAVAARETGGRYPTLDAFFAAEKGAEDSHRTPFVDRESYALGLVARYEIDLWGRVAAIAEARELEAGATLADYRAAALTLSAEVVRAWYERLEAHDQLLLAAEQVRTNEAIVDLLEERFRNGLSRAADLLRQRQLLEATRERRLVAESRIAVLDHKLAVLLGEPPRTPVPFTSRDLPEPPPLPRTGLPTELVQRRPDVTSALLRVRAADRETAAAIRDRYPRLDLAISGSTIAGSIDDLFVTWAYAVIGEIVAPLFDGGRRVAEVDRARAVTRQRLYEYGQTVLVAFREVEDALVQERKQAERLRSLESQVRLARQSYERLQQEYFNGVVDYIEVLTALSAEQRLRRDLLTGRLDLLEQRIALYRALAGGFETEREAEANG